MKRILALLSGLCLCATLCCACTKDEVQIVDPPTGNTESQSTSESETPADTPSAPDAGTNGSTGNSSPSGGNATTPNTEAYGPDWTYDY